MWALCCYFKNRMDVVIEGRWRSDAGTVVLVLRHIIHLIPAEFHIGERYLVSFSIKQGQKHLSSPAVPQTSSGATWGWIAYSALYRSFEKKYQVWSGFWKVGTIGTTLRTESAFPQVSRETLPVASALLGSVRIGNTCWKVWWGHCRASALFRVQPAFFQVEICSPLPTFNNLNMPSAAVCQETNHGYLAPVWTISLN